MATVAKSNSARFDSGEAPAIPAHLSSHFPQNEIDVSEHFVQFYESDDFLVDSVSSFLGAGLGAGASCIVIATSAHREGIEQLLQTNGLDLNSARMRSKYISIDIDEALSQFMVDGQPDRARFFKMLESLMAKASTNGKPLRIFGEMVALLWMEGNQAAALQLEALWNELHSASPSFLLFCAYPMHSFVGEAYETFFAQICQQHSHVIPDESYMALANPDERMRAVSLLQQKAISLHAEIAERKLVEERLWISENRYRRLFEASTDGILMVEPQTGIISDANPSMTELLGMAREQVVGQDSGR